MAEVIHFAILADIQQFVKSSDIIRIDISFSYFVRFIGDQFAVSPLDSRKRAIASSPCELPWSVYAQGRWRSQEELQGSLRKQAANGNRNDNRSWNSSIPRRQLDETYCIKHKISNLVYPPVGYKFNWKLEM